MDEHGKLERNGGNVASYFCTADGHVIHAVTGPVGAEELLDEAHWAVAAYDAASSGLNSDVPAVLARQHRLAPQRDHGRGRTSNAQAIHQLLARSQMPTVNDVYVDVFEKILGQRVNLPGSGVEQVAEAVDAAKNRKLPLLFILHKEQRNSSIVATWKDLLAQHRNRHDPLAKLAASYVTIALPLDSLSAVSQRLGIRPYAAPDNSSPLFVVARPDARQLTAVTTWENSAELTRALAQGMVQAAKEQPRTEVQLATLLPLVAPVDSSLAGEVRRLQVQAKVKSPARRALGRGEKVAMADVKP